MWQSGADHAVGGRARRRFVSRIPTIAAIVSDEPGVAEPLQQPPPRRGVLGAPGCDVIRGAAPALRGAASFAAHAPSTKIEAGPVATRRAPPLAYRVTLQLEPSAATVTPTVPSGAAGESRITCSLPAAPGLAIV